MHASLFKRNENISFQYLSQADSKIPIAPIYESGHKAADYIKIIN